MAKYEYLLHVWGGFFNEENIAKHGQLPGYYWFDTHETREKKLRELLELSNKFNAKELAREFHEGFDARLRTVASMVLSHNGHDYPFSYDFGYGYPDHSAVFMFTEGNYSCDCNLSLFLGRKYGHLSELNLPCGNAIKVSNIEIFYTQGTDANFERSE